MFSRQLATAKRLISKYGETVTVTGNNLTQDPDTPWITTTDVKQYKTKMVFFTVGTQVEKSLMFANDKPYPIGSLLGYSAYSNFDFKLDQTITRGDGSILRIKNIDVLNPNGEKLLFTLVFEQ